MKKALIKDTYMYIINLLYIYSQKKRQNLHLSTDTKYIKNNTEIKQYFQTIHTYLYIFSLF